MILGLKGLINAVVILSPNSYSIANYTDEQQEQRIYPSYRKRANVKLSKSAFKDFADLIFIGSFAHNFGPREYMDDGETKLRLGTSYASNTLANVWIALY